MLIVSTSWAQSEPKMNYQAVLRDSQNKLVANTPVQVTLTVQNAAGVAYYTEPQSTVTTNQNGLMTLTFGGGTNWNTVNWKDANLVIDATWGEGNNINIENRRGLCPEGWHLPTESEWASMVTGKAGGFSIRCVRD